MFASIKTHMKIFQLQPSAAKTLRFAMHLVKWKVFFFVYKHLILFSVCKYLNFVHNVSFSLEIHFNHLREWFITYNRTDCAGISTKIFKIPSQIVKMHSFSFSHLSRKRLINNQNILIIAIIFQVFRISYGKQHSTHKMERKINQIEKYGKKITRR